MNDCEYDSTNKHQCTHQHYCIFNNKRNELENRILQVNKKLEEFNHIKHCFINDEIIYHEELDDCYIIDKVTYTSADGKTKYKIGVKCSDNFIGMLNIKIENLKYDLKSLENYKRDIIHGKIGGYGYEF